MRPAHQGIPVAALPGTATASAGGLPLPFNLPWMQQPQQRPTPPAAIPDAAARPSPHPEQAGGMDNWFLDRLFGRR